MMMRKEYKQTFSTASHNYTDSAASYGIMWSYLYNFIYSFKSYINRYL